MDYPPKTTLEKEKTILSPEAEDMCKETESLLKGLPTQEEVMKMPEEKQKLYFSKSKIALTAIGLAGLTTFLTNYGHLDLNIPETINASKEAVFEGMGLLMTVGAAIGLKLRDIYEKVTG